MKKQTNLTVTSISKTSARNRTSSPKTLHRYPSEHYTQLQICCIALQKDFSKTWRTISCASDGPDGTTSNKKSPHASTHWKEKKNQESYLENTQVTQNNYQTTNPDNPTSLPIEHHLWEKPWHQKPPYVHYMTHQCQPVKTTPHQNQIICTLQGNELLPTSRNSTPEKNPMKSLIFTSTTIFPAPRG